MDCLSLVDLSAEGMHSKVVSLAEHNNKVSSLDLSVSLDKNLSPMAPMGTISTNLAQIRLVMVTPFVMKTVVRQTSYLRYLYRLQTSIYHRIRIVCLDIRSTHKP